MKTLTVNSLALGLLTYPIWEMVADSFNTNFGLLLVVLVFTVIDGISGVYAAFREGTANSKTFFEKFLDKFVAYIVIIILCFGLVVLVHTTQGYEVEKIEFLFTYPLSVIIAREFWSIGENINKIQPELFDKIKNTLNIFKR